MTNRTYSKHRKHILAAASLIGLIAAQNVAAQEQAADAEAADVPPPRLDHGDDGS